MTNVSDYPNGMAPRSALVLFEGVWVSPDMASRLAYAFARIRERGATISLTEGYRWKGVESDRAIGRRNGNPGGTSDGTSNQFYQKGREDGGFTPSAATPGYSNHGKGDSVDTDCSSIAIRDEEFAKVGLHRDIASETWHATIYKDPEVNLDQEADDMYDQAARDEVIGRIDTRVVAKLDQLLNRGPVFQRFRNSKTGEISLAGWGVWWPIPNPAYQELLVARGLTTSSTINVPENEYEFFKSLYLLSETNDAAIVAAVAKLTIEEAQRAADAIKAADKAQKG